MANTKVTSRVLANDAVLTANIADDQVTTAKIADDVALGGNPTTTTQSAGNNTTRIATTAFVTTAVANIVDSAPSALDTLNELAAALGDDANFSTTITNSIAGKVALSGAGQTIADSGNLTLDVAGDIILDADGGDIQLKDGGSTFGLLSNDNFTLKIQNHAQDTDISFIGNDGGSLITALTLDMSAAGAATFNSSIIMSGVGSLTEVNANFCISGTDADHAGLIMATHAILPAEVGAEAAANVIDLGANGNEFKSLYLNTSIITDSNLTLDIGGNLTLDADGDHTIFAYGGSGEVGRVSNESENLVIYSLKSDKDIKFNGVDSSSTITALTLDMSAAGAATFNAGVTATTGTFSGLVTMGGIEVDQYVTHAGDTNTYMEFGTDTLDLRAGNIKGLTVLGTGEVVVNQEQADVDFRVESDSDAYALFVKASTSNVGIGEQSPAAPLHVEHSSATAYDGTAEITESLIVSNKNGTDDSGVNNVASIGLHVADGATSQGFINYVRTGNNTGKFTFSHRKASTTYTEDFVITDAGTYGMGAGSGSLAGSIIINNDGGTGTINNAYYNTVLGWEAADDLTSGDSNTIVGNQAGYKLTEATGNTLLGRLAGEQLTTGSYNTAIGFNTMGDATVTGSSNTAVGNSVMVAVTSGAGNTALGEACAAALTTGSNNVAIGRSALSNGAVTGSYNIGVGYEALKAVTSGYENVCLGRDAGHDITSGFHNVAVGHESLTKMQSSSQCVAVGFQALENAYSHSNVGIGYKAGENITSATNNICIGKESGTSSSPSGNLTTTSNTICLGDDNIGNLFCADTSIASSDSRDKADITNFTQGLSFITKMQPVTYKWDRRSWYLPQDEDGNVTDDDITKVTPDGSKKDSKTHIGFLAQDVETLEQEIGFASDENNRLFTNLTDDGNRYGIKYERLVTVLVNAVKELDTKLAAAEARIKTLEES